MKTMRVDLNDLSKKRFSAMLERLNMGYPLKFKNMRPRDGRKPPNLSSSILRPRLRQKTSSLAKRLGNSSGKSSSIFTLCNIVDCSPIEIISPVQSPPKLCLKCVHQ